MPEQVIALDYDTQNNYLFCSFYKNICVINILDRTQVL